MITADSDHAKPSGEAEPSFRLPSDASYSYASYASAVGRQDDLECLKSQY